MDFKKLYKELVRRNVFRAIVAYLAVSWVIIEAASTLLPTFGAPEFLLKGLIYLLGIGFIFWTGFSWIYDLTPEGLQKTTNESVSPENRQFDNRRLNAVIVGSGIMALLVLLAGSFWAGSKWNSPDKLEHFRIAVLPFEDRSDNTEFDYLKEGLAEDVISELANSKRLSVISSKSSFQYRDTDKSIEQISKELNADVVLVGNYAITNQDIDVKMEVIGARDNEILNYASITGKLSHISDISGNIGANIYGALEIPESKAVKTIRAETKDVNVEAFKFNALGKSAMRDHTGQKREEITRYFKAAIEKDSTYADPYIGMAEALIFDVNRGYISSAEASGEIKEYALKAEKLNPGSGQVSCIMGIIHSFEYDFNGAVPYFEIALEKSPNYALTYQWYAFALEMLGDFEKALELQKKAGNLDPLDNFNEIYLAMNYIFQGKLNRAQQVIDNKLALNPDHLETLWIKAVLLSEKGMYQEAYDLLVKRELGLETGFIPGYVFARLGQKERAQRVLDNMLSRSYVPPSQIAILLCGLEEYEAAIEKVEEAFLLHDQWIGWALFSSMTDPIKTDPRFRSIMQQINNKKQNMRVVSGTVPSKFPGN
ncbi:tetratricopeptide repeat protein [Robiginitalea aurantiaca]|uniref:FlgO family outer membrane protein n=1 Tax=Robiginitalea aurantiaca TaxID=3056915 RepID=A0ABT7WHE5_9FLAO|nr:FlgO family outer membrane protein [Robiginitalea aurantiaca]MDM9632229.1 FlgO family outer membrane protein [Robiginitalea aurantiaca]